MPVLEDMEEIPQEMRLREAVRAVCDALDALTSVVEDLAPGHAVSLGDIAVHLARARELL